MIPKLISLFVKTDRPDKRRAQIGILAGIANVLCNLFLFVLKLSVGLISGSVAVAADAFNNLSDSAASLVTVVGFHLGSKPPDRKHPFGYGRLEYVAGVVISVFILIVAFEFIKSSVEQIFSPEPIAFNWIMLITLLIAIAIKLLMWRMNSQFAKVIGGSSTLSATAFDSLSDVATTTVALLSLILSPFLSFPIDGILGVLIALFVFVGGIKVLLDTINPLLGQPPSPEMVEELKTRVLSYDHIVGIHDIIIHNYGPSRTIATLHAEVPANHDVIFAHETIDRAEREIAREMGITVVIHLDPIVTDDNRLNAVRTQVSNCLTSLSPDYSMHDFRMLDGKEQINLLFDVLLPYEEPRSEQEIEQDIIKALQKEDPRFFPIITFDRSFVG